MLNIKKITKLFLLFGISLFLVVGCSDDDNNPVHGDDDHFHAVGSKLVVNGEDLIVSDTADSSDVIGVIELEEGEESDHMQVWFLNDENEWYYPGNDPDSYSDYQLELVIGNGDLIDGQVEGWELHLSGMNEGSSWIRVRVKHEDHYGYISPHFRTAIHHHEGAHGEPVGMFLISGTDTLVTTDASGTVTGELSVSVGSSTDSITAWFFDEHGESFQPEEDHLLAINIEGTGSVTSSFESAWTFTLSGISSGDAIATFSVLHDGHSHFTSPAVPIHVE